MGTIYDHTAFLMTPWNFKEKHNHYILFNTTTAYPVLKSIPNNTFLLDVFCDKNI